MEKILTLDQIKDAVQKLRQDKQSIVLVGGCFDILHPGHITFLERAKRTGDNLIVALESDENVTRLKGKGRPINSQVKRANALSALHVIDYILLLPPVTTDAQYVEIVENIHPNTIAITDGDPHKSKKEQQAHAIGGAVLVVTEYLKEYSTTKILNQQ